MFEYVSTANFFGECVEWCGFAIAGWSLPAAAFALYTVANLVPRARARHHHTRADRRCSGQGHMNVDDSVEGFGLIHVLEGESLPALLLWVFPREALLVRGSEIS
eukprot:jgi/Undpi1/3810/HiC_scaffold_16.g07179.m1